MKSILAVALLAAMVAAEVPSNSYLPPPPNRGYSQSSPPSIIAARTLNQGTNDHDNGDHHDIGAARTLNGFARSGVQNYDSAAQNLGVQSRFNKDDQGYGQNAGGFARNAVVDINATVNYKADQRGYKPQISYEDSEANARSGYDSNANNFRANNGYHGNGQDGGQANARSGGYN